MSYYENVYVNFVASNAAKTFPVNKYFLLLYNKFYRKLLVDHDMNSELMFIFDEMTSDDLEKLVAMIYDKHLGCSDDDEVRTVNKGNNNSEDVGTVRKDSDDVFIEGNPVPDTVSDSVKNIVSKLLEEETANVEAVMDDDSEKKDMIKKENQISKCPYECFIGKAMDKDELYAHIHLVHDRNEKDTEASCSPQFKESLKELLKNLDTEISLKCYFKCSKVTYRSSQLLKEHYTKCHVNPKCNSDQKICPDCGKLVRNQRMLGIHISTVHTREFKFECTLCDRKFFLRNELKRHNLSAHEKKKLFPCEICGTRFTQFYNMNAHRQKLHDGVPFLSVKMFRGLVADGKHPFLAEITPDFVF